MITIIPVKPLAESKSRLAAILSPAQRAELSRRLLTRTVRIAAEISPVLVVTRDERAAEAAEAAGARALAERGCNLNEAIRQGLAWARERRFAAALILPLDLPRLTATELKGLVRLGRQTSPSLVIAPCRRNRGTNALLLRPPDLISPQFGPDSFLAHRAAAEALGLPLHIYCAPGLAFDLDTPADWQEFALANLEQPLQER